MFPWLTAAFQILDEIRHSVTVIKDLPPDVQAIARQVYYEALKYTFIATTVVTVIALISAFFARGQSLNRTR